MSTGCCVLGDPLATPRLLMGSAASLTMLHTDRALKSIVQTFNFAKHHPFRFGFGKSKPEDEGGWRLWQQGQSLDTYGLYLDGGPFFVKQ